MAQEFDLVVRGGRIVDGTGCDAFVGDIGVRDGRITAVGPTASVTIPESLQYTFDLRANSRMFSFQGKSTRSRMRGLAA